MNAESRPADSAFVLCEVELNDDGDDDDAFGTDSVWPLLITKLIKYLFPMVGGGGTFRVDIYVRSFG